MKELNFKTAFLPAGRHQAFVPNYDLCKISNFLNKIFLFLLKQTLHNFPKVGNTQSPSFYSPNQLSYFSRSWNFSKMANTQSKSDQLINPSLFHHQWQFLQHKTHVSVQGIEFLNAALSPWRQFGESEALKSLKPFKISQIQLGMGILRCGAPCSFTHSLDQCQSMSQQKT